MVADILPVLLEHVSTSSKSFSEVNLSTWKVFVIIAIFMRVFSHFAKDSRFSKSHCYLVLDNILLFALICGCQEKEL